MMLTPRSVAKPTLDLLVWVLAAPMAYVLRLEGDVALHAVDIAVYSLAGGAVKGGWLAYTRESLRSWHRIGMRDMYRLVLGVVVVTVVALAVAAFGSDLLFVPRSVPLIEAMLAVLGLAGLRFSTRLYYEEVGVSVE